MRAILYALALILWPCQSIAACPVRLTFVDVGEGDSAVVEVSGQPPLVIDTGSPLGASALVSYLQKRAFPNLSGIILTHPHLDHIGGLFTLRILFPRTPLYHTAQPLAPAAAAEDIYRWYGQMLSASEALPRVLRRGDEFSVGVVKFDVLWPPRGELDQDWNKNSLVLRLTFGSFRALFMADALESTEKELLRLEPDTRAAVLKVGHHGSKFASSEPFIAAVAPKLSVVSVNAGNIRGYPSAEILARLRTTGEVLRTDERGSIQICADPSGEFRRMEPR